MIDNKEMYIKYKNPLSDNIKACFKKAESYEERLGKDLSEWTAAEIIEFYKSLCTPSVDFLHNIHCVYKAYTTWCLTENMLKDNINHYDEITQDLLLKCINKVIADQRIISREDLLNIIKQFPDSNPRDQFICLACFEGLSGKAMEDLISVRLSDFKDGYILTKNKKIPYSKELYNYAKEAANTYRYYITLEDRIREFEMIGDSDQIIKKVVSNNANDSETEITVYSIYRIINQVQSQIDNPAFTSKALKESGRINMIREYMAKGMKIEDAVKATYPVYGKLIAIAPYINKYNDFLK